jgi:hypothetical protein
LIEATLTLFGGMKRHRNYHHGMKIFRCKLCGHDLGQPAPEQGGDGSHPVILQQMNQFPEHTLVAAKRQGSPVGRFILSASGTDAVVPGKRGHKEIATDAADGHVQGLNLAQTAITDGNSGKGNQGSVAKTAVTGEKNRKQTLCRKGDPRGNRKDIDGAGSVNGTS